MHRKGEEKNKISEVALPIQRIKWGKTLVIIKTFTTKSKMGLVGTSFRDAE